MARVEFKPGNMLYPLPAVLITAADRNGKSNMCTVAWAGTICSDPPMVSISLRKSRYTHELISETGEFVINLTTKDLTFATDYAGVKSGRDVDKWKELNLTKADSLKVSAPSIEESPVSIECKVTEVKELGTHDMFIAEVIAVTASDKYMTETGKFEFMKSEPIAYSHGEYYTLGEKLGKFGYSVKNK